MSVVENDYSNFTAFPLEAVEQSIPERFEQQANLFPKRVAVADENVSFTYTQLNAYANKIAHAIMAKIGHEPSQRVVIYFEKSAAYIAAIMGILKAGHTYVPIDPAFPLSRNEYILSNSDASLIVTNAAFSADAEAFSARDIGKVFIDELSPELADTNPQIKITPDALAYIIYTSGSTGKPKGVMQNHRNTLHGCMRRTNLQQIVPDDRMTLFYSPSVMGSVYCIFGALLNGAGLYPYDIREEGLDDLAEWLKQRKITIYHSVASVFRQFARFYQGSNEDFSIQLVIFGGEKVLTSDVHLARKVFSNCIQFFTGLGSTETGTIRHFPIAPETEIASKVVPIGYPVEGVEIILTDDSGKPVATGDVGEITVHSPYIALGYWKDEENTQRAFSQPDPQNPVRIYRTGDMGQLDESGLLVHKGRKDFQVKIRGFRVEIGEVETALQDIPGVDEAVVIALDLAGQSQLVAYLTFKTDAEQPTVRQVRQHLQQKLPYYMVPSFFAALSEMPRTPNNKIDRKSLPQPNPEIELKEEELLAPASETEQLLVDICQELLAKKDYGVNRSFFEHGGDSLSATQLVARVNYKKGVKLGMQAVFTAEDLRVLAEHIDGLAPASTQNVIAPLKAETQNSRPSVSFAQRRMWLTTQLLGGSAAYNISNTVKLKGELNAAALEQALNRIVERQELLRARIPSDDNGPWLEIDPYRHMTLPLVDLQHLPPGEAEAKARQIAGEALAKPHDLAKGPLFEAQLLQIDDTTAMLVLVFNHIIYDNIWSSGIFFRELEAFYAQACGEVSVALPETPSIQFSDFARWEQQNASRDQDEHLQYWKKQLENLPEPLQVAGDYRRPETPSLSGGQVRFELPADIAGGIQFFAKSESATLFMVLMAAWQVLLARYSGQQDILVGTPTGRRYRTETENLIGLFINNLVIRTQLSAELSFRELLRKVRQTTIDAFAHDEIPFEKLVEEINPPRFSGVSPFFQHLFIHRNASKSQWSLPGVQVEPVALHPGGSKFDLTLSILEKHEAISGTLEYSRDLFSEDTVTRMAANYVELLASIIHSPDTLVDRLSLVAAEESRLVLNEWNQTRQDYPKDSCTYQLFEQIVEQYADKTALVGEDQTLSYADFNYKANQLAHLLRDKGVQPDDLVAVCVDRSADLIIALMAVFKAGAAYVPLDPHFPADRLSYMIENSQAKLFIAQSHILDRLPDLSATPILMDAGEREYDTRPGANLTPLSGPDNLAYVIYTSGSTGKPKGVQITHRALVNFLCSMQDEPGLTPDDVMQAITTICFDIAALEIFLPLITGARVVVSSRETSIVAPRLLESIENNGATVMQATPVTWRMLIESGWRGEPKLRVFCGGEAMGTDLAAQLVDTGCEIWNLYGPTETTIWSTVCRINQASDATVIGHPIANTELLVCSPQLQLQPIGVPGELLIGGDGLARGYFKREDITKEKFIAHVFNDGERLYRTGDMVIRRPNGDIEFLGRMDNQVKIRGFRIELGDIETHIATFDDVQHAVVIAREDSPGEKRLVAYMISHSGDEISAASLRDYLKSRLPDYMVPAAFVTLAEFPQTPNGKVDRKQLPAPLVSSKPKAPPAHSMDTLGERVMAIFESVLGNSVTSVNDNFFDLGGHSLLALKAVEAINQQFSTNLSPAIIFDLQTPAELAAVLAQSQDGLLSSEDFAYPKTTPEEEALVDAMLAQIRALAKKSDSLNQNAPYMRESWLGKNLISKIYPGRRRSIRRLLEFILLRIEGGRAYSVTMRKLYKKLYNIEVGNYTNTRFDAVRLKRNTKIGKFCSIVRSASFQNADHPIKALSTHAIFYHKKFGFTEGFELDRKRLEIGNDVWIGEGARILYPTQKIGDGAVIASGAVVVEDVPPYAIVGGYPAQVLRYRFSKQTIDKLLELKWWDYPLEELHKVNGLFMQPLEGKGMR